MDILYKYNFNNIISIEIRYKYCFTYVCIITVYQFIDKVYTKWSSQENHSDFTNITFGRRMLSSYWAKNKYRESVVVM